MTCRRAYHARVYFWTCEAALQRYRERPYDVWRRHGLVTITEGDVTDYTRIRHDVSEIARRLGVQKIAYDRRGALQLSQELMGDGLAMVEQGQGFFLSEPTKTLSRLVAAGPEHFTHDPNACLDWQAGNLSVLRGTRNDLRPVKTFGPEKIDGMVVLIIMALAHATTPPPPPKPTGSVYDTRDVFILGGDDD